MKADTLLTGRYNRVTGRSHSVEERITPSWQGLGLIPHAPLGFESLQLVTWCSTVGGCVSYAFGPVVGGRDKS